MAGASASVSNDLLGHYIDKAGSNSFIRTKGFALITGAVSGGIGAELGGGNFWMGAGQGLIVTAFNFLAHRETTSLDNNGDGDDPGKGKKVNNKSNKESSIQDWERIPDKDIPKVKDLGWDHGDKNGGKDLYRNRKTGQINERPRNAPRGVIGEDTGYNWNDVKKNVTTVVGIAYGTYVGVKWIIAIGGAPETGGASLLLLLTP